MTTPSTVVVPWVLTDLDTAETYSFTINPNKQSNSVPARGIQWDRVAMTGDWTGRRAGRQPHPWSFSGVVRTEEQHEAFKLWARKTVKVRLATDVGQNFILRLLSYKPTQEAGTRGAKAPFRHTYTMDCLIFETESIL